MRKDISRVKTPSPTLGKLARLREMRAPDPRPRLGLADFGERIAARALRRDSRAWRRFSLEYLMEDEAGEKAPQTAPAEGAPWNLDVLFQIYAGAEPGFVERIVERQMRLLLPRAPLRRNEADAPAAARPAAWRRWPAPCGW